MTGLADRSASLPLPGGVRVEGTVVRVQADCSRSCSYQPVIRYVVGGRSYTILGAYHGGAPAVGSPEPVSYDPAHPAVARDLGGYSTNWMASIVVGALLLVAAVVLSVRAGVRRYGRQ